MLPDDSYRELQAVLALRPETGAVIPGGGGLRKVRWSVPGQGKRGGLRIIYFWDSLDTIYMLLPYRKSRTRDLTPLQIKALRSLVEGNLQ